MCFARATNVPTAVSGGAKVNLPPGVTVIHNFGDATRQPGLGAATTPMTPAQLQRD
jgi:hypothetical protein